MLFMQMLDLESEKMCQTLSAAGIKFQKVMLDMKNSELFINKDM